VENYSNQSTSPGDGPIRIKITQENNNNVEMRRLVLCIQGKLPNVSAAGAELRALRILLNLQLAEAALLKPGFSRPTDAAPI
jgi:hypothetical protein